jgi:hypothetical protein
MAIDAPWVGDSRRLVGAPLLFLLVLTLGCHNADGSGLPFLVGYDFEDGQEDGFLSKSDASWQVTEEDGSLVYQLLAPGEFGAVRAPAAWSVLQGFPVSSFSFTGRLKSHTDPDVVVRDLCVIFHYQDPTHFYYAHFAASSDEVHNIIGLVNGADRVKINREPAGESVFRLTDSAWHDFKVTFVAATGEIEAFLDDMETPILTASDSTLPQGLVGVGSFDDTGSFDDLMLWGEVVNR